MPLVSIIVPVYNAEIYLRECLDSLINQTYKNIEIIVVDDCSTDNTLKNLKSIKDKRLRIVKLEKNSGACAARNKGIDEAKGKYIAFQDSDDLWHDDKLESQLSFMKDNKALVSFCNFNKMNEKNEVKTQFPIGVKEGVISYLELLNKSISSTQCIIVHKKCLNNVRFDEKLPRLQDWDFTLELAKKYDVYHYDKVLVDVFIQPNSISKNPEKGIKALKIIKEKNEEAILTNKMINYNWNIYMGYYVLGTKNNPTTYYGKALKIHFNFVLFIMYLLCKLHVFVPLYFLF